ncbi:hypothetical protein GGX14DRAFT_480061 [Mycena pura]|uniref:F-box domain-containing protein n=1 Tax=Mycena pura TaxID=153505 RepID=A0AAD6Y5I3_9AGAR|nr:hypothetical protein GGX14DRAFT_480061 [Mycena pura]
MHRRRWRQRTTMNLPPEICAKICEELGQKDRVTLCRTSRLLGDQVQRLIYRTVDLRRCTAQALRSWCLAVTRHSELAERVHVLSLGLPTDLASSSDLGKIARALSRCLNVKELSIHPEDSGPFGDRYESAMSSIQGWLITKCPFRLTKFSHSYFKNAFLSEFWTPQSDIRVLAIPTCTEKFPCYDDQLPNLIALEVGGVGSLPIGRALQRIQLRWSRYSAEELDELSALGRYSATLTMLNLVQTRMTEQISTLQILDRVVHGLPGLLHLGITEFTELKALRQLKIADRFSEPSPLTALAKFTRLETFVFYTQTITGFEDFTLDHVYELDDHLNIQRFGLAIMEACPTLRRADVGARIFPDSPAGASYDYHPRQELTCTATRTSISGAVAFNYGTHFDFNAVAKFWDA